MNSETFIIKIDSLSYGGRGVGRREDGKVVFVPDVIPGETVRVRMEKDHTSYCLAGLVEVIEAFPGRVSPECRHFSECGGCDWQHISYADQISWKGRILTDEICRRSQASGSAPAPPVPSEKTYGYRGHTVLQCGYDKGLVLGFHRKKTNNIVEIDRCPVLNSRLDEIFRGLRRILKEQPIKELLTIEIHAPQEESIVLLKCGRTDPRAVLSLMERIHRELGVSGISCIISGPKKVSHVVGKRSCSYVLDMSGRKVTLSSTFGEFIQANIRVNEALVSYVSGLAGGSGHVLDLYCGSGNFSIPLSFVSSQVTGIERSSRLIEQGRVAAKKNKAGNVTFHEIDAEKAIHRMAGDLGPFDTIVLDPPREGAKEIAGRLPELMPSRIVYVSCNPTTLARDLKPLLTAGYSLRSLRMFDMFPQTYHIEAVAYLEQ